ncbi:MAG TPA: PaaI family thioesterase [Ilumatobacteraceae bacterium]|nr:PaaI family thioesterase [Ilumatobacteraceae bacterium]
MNGNSGSEETPIEDADVVDQQDPPPNEPPAAPRSAGELIRQLADQIPDVATVPAEAYRLASEVRRLNAAVVLSDVDPKLLGATADAVARLTDILGQTQRDHLQIVRHPDGRVESMRNAGSGVLNPQAPPIEWITRPAAPAPGSPVQPVEVVARCTYTAAHGGSPGCVYGGVLALTLDEVTGIAIHASGARGMTVALNVALRGAVPIGVPVTITARYTGSEGRKSFATGTLTVDGRVSAEASVIYVAERTAEDGG